jgi:hypothetical protein
VTDIRSHDRTDAISVSLSGVRDMRRPSELLPEDPLVGVVTREPLSIAPRGIEIDPIDPLTTPLPEVELMEPPEPDIHPLLANPQYDRS